jgi:hypothetical protein
MTNNHEPATPKITEQPKRGRPVLPVEDRKIIHLAIRLCPAEHAKFEAAARRKKMPLAKFICEAVRRALKDEEGGGA